MTTTVSRLALDALRSARVRREAYVGPWLPEPIVAASLGRGADVPTGEDVSLALLVVLESLSANERIAFVLHDVFGYAFDEVATALGTSTLGRAPAASRARKAVEARRPRFPATPEQQRDVVARLRARRARGRHRRAAGDPAPGRRVHLRRRRRVTAARKPIEGATASRG